MLDWLRRSWAAVRRGYAYRKGELRLPVTLGIAIFLSIALYRNGQAVALHLAQVFVVWIVVFGVARLPALVRAWRQVLLFCVATIASLLVLGLADGLIAEKIIFNQYNMSVDHRHKPQPGRSNQDGVQPDRPASAYEDAGFNIIFLGDSFVEGVTMGDRTLVFPALIERELQRRRPAISPMVANFGWLSSSPLLQRRQLQDIGARYHPDLVLQCVDMTDFHNDLSYTTSLESTGLTSKDVSIFRLLEVRLSLWLGVSSFIQHLASNLGIRTHEPDSATLLESPIPDDRFFHLRQPLAESRQIFDLTWEYILQTRQEAQSLGAGFALFILPRHQQYNRAECPRNWEDYLFPASDEYLFEAFHYFDAKAVEAPFPVHSLLSDFAGCGEFPTVFEGDPHYNETGHAVAAQAILRYLEADGLLP